MEQQPTETSELPETPETTEKMPFGAGGANLGVRRG